MFCWNIYLSKRLQYVAQINHSYHHIFNKSSQNIFLIKPNGYLLEINDSALKYYSLIKEDICGKPLWEVFSQVFNFQHQQELQDAVIQAALGKSIQLNIELLETKDTDINCEFLFTPVTDEKNKILLIVVEVYQKNQVEATEFELQKQLLQTSFDNASIGLAILDDQLQYLLKITLWRILMVSYQLSISYC